MYILQFWDTIIVIKKWKINLCFFSLVFARIWGKKTPANDQKQRPQSITEPFCVTQPFCFYLCYTRLARLSFSCTFSPGYFSKGGGFNIKHMSLPGMTCRKFSIKEKTYRKFSIKGAGRWGKPLGGALIRERAFPPSRGVLQNENRTIFGWDMAKNVKEPNDLGAKRGGRPYRGWRP